MQMRKHYNGGSIHAYLNLNYFHPNYLTVRIYRGVGSVFKDVQKNLRKQGPYYWRLDGWKGHLRYFLSKKFS